MNPLRFVWSIVPVLLLVVVGTASGQGITEAQGNTIIAALAGSGYSSGTVGLLQWAIDSEDHLDNLETIAGQERDALGYEYNWGSEYNYNLGFLQKIAKWIAPIQAGLPTTGQTLQGELVTTIADLDLVVTKLATVVTNTGNINTTLGTTNATLSTISSRLSTVSSDLATVKTSVASINNYAGAVAHDTALMQPDVAAMKVSLSDSVGSLATIVTKLTSISSDLVAMHTLMSDYLPELYTIRLKLTSIDANVAALGDDVAAIRDNTDTMVGLLSGIHDDLTPPLSNPPNLMPDTSGFIGAFYGKDAMTLEEFVGHERDVVIVAPQLNMAGVLPTVGSVPGSAPVWTFDLLLTSWLGGALPAAGLHDFHCVINWGFWSPFRALASYVMLFGVSLSTMAMCWEEVRKYG